MAHTKKDAISSENTVYQNTRTVLVTARQEVYSAINSASRRTASRIKLDSLPAFDEDRQ